MHTFINNLFINGSVVHIMHSLSDHLAQACSECMVLGTASGAYICTSSGGDPVIALRTHVRSVGERASFNIETSSCTSGDLSVGPPARLCNT